MATIQGVYVALFGRPADPAGLAYFNGVTNNGQDLAAIANLAGQKEFTDRFAGQSNIQIVNSIYQSLFNRDAETAGLNFFVDALNKGTLNVNNIAIAILDGAQGNDKTIAANKVAAADLFTKSLDTAKEIGSYTGDAANASARAWLQTVTTTAATQAAVDAEIKAIEVIGTGGVTLNIAAAANVSPTATDATLKTTNGDDTINAAGNPGTVDGGFGTDTLNLKTSAAWAPAADAVKNIEILNVTATGAHGVDLTNVAGLEQVWNVNSEANASAITAINDGATLGVKGTSATVEFGFAKAQTGTTNIVLDKATIATSLTVTSGAETVALNSTGGSTVASFVDATVKTLNITGSGNVGVTFAAADVALAKVDASALTGGSATLDFTAIVAGQKLNITGTNAADTITLATASAADVIVYSTSEASTFSLRETVANFETGIDKLDLKAFGFTNTAVTAFSVAPVEGAAYGAGASVGYQGGLLYVDSNKNGVIDLATDFVIDIAGGVAAADIIWA